MKKIDFNTILHSDNRRSKMASKIALIAVTLSFAVIVLALCIADGFREQINNKAIEILDYAHITEQPSYFVTSDQVIFDSTQISEINSIIAPEALIPTISSYVVIQNGINVLPTTIVGAKNNGIKNGTIALSRTAALELNVQINETIELLYFIDQIAAIKSLRVDSIYNSMLYDIERQLAFVSFDEADLIANREGESVSYYAIKNPINFVKIEQYANEEGFLVESIEQRAPQLYGWLSMIDQNMLLVLLIMTIVATINIITSTLIVILDSTTKIAVLRSLGMNRQSVEKLFFNKMIKLITIGAVIGILVGLTLAFVQKHLGIITLDSSLYFVDKVPIYADFINILLYSIIMFALIALTLLLPIKVISRISISRTIKYQ